VTKLLPITVKVNAAPPTVAVLGESDATAGVAGAEIVKVIEAWPPPGWGFETISWVVPVPANCVAAMVVVNCEELTKVTFCCVPFQFSVELARKFEPETVSVKPALPAVAAAGETDSMAGTGFSVGATGGEELLFPPQEHNTKDKHQGRQRGNNRRALAIAISTPQSNGIRLTYCRYRKELRENKGRRSHRQVPNLYQCGSLLSALALLLLERLV
jgi:hypothetical protein